MLVGYSWSRPPLTTNNGLFRRLLGNSCSRMPMDGFARIRMWPISGRKLAYGVVSRIAM